MTVEQFFSGLELRAEGRRLIGPAINYGEVSPSHREKFTPGAFDLDDGRTRTLNLRHDPDKAVAYTDGGGLILRDTSQELQVFATLPRIPAAERALAEVREGKLTGFSIEFHAEAEHRESGIRVVSKAVLAGIGLVAHPSYTGSKAEVRAGSMSGFVPFGEKVDCECHESGTRTRSPCTIEIQGVSFDESRDVLATAGRLENAIASKRAGSLVLEETDAGLQVSIGADVLEATAAGRELVKTASVVPVFARPLFNQAESDWTERGGVAVYRDMRITGVLVKPTFNDKGWKPVEFAGQRREAIREPLPGPVLKIPKTNGRARPWL